MVVPEHPDVLRPQPRTPGHALAAELVPRRPEGVQRCLLLPHVREHDPIREDPERRPGRTPARVGDSPVPSGPGDIDERRAADQAIWGATLALRVDQTATQEALPANDPCRRIQEVPPRHDALQILLVPAVDVPHDIVFVDHHHPLLSVSLVDR